MILLKNGADGVDVRIQSLNFHPVATAQGMRGIWQMLILKEKKPLGELKIRQEGNQIMEFFEQINYCHS